MSKGKILVVEPDDDIRNMLKVYFSEQGYDVVTTTNGKDALNEAQGEELPDVIIVYVNLPDMDGFELCRVLRTTRMTSRIPIIFLAERDDERFDGMIDRWWNFDDYMSKPFDIEELKLRIQNAIDATKRRQSINPDTGLLSGKEGI